MERADQRKISRNLVTVKKALKKDIDVIMDDLVEVGIFTKQTISEIEDAGPQMKCGVFISKLLRSCPRAYRCFKDILEEHGHQKLVISMERSKTLCMYKFTELQRTGGSIEGILKISFLISERKHTSCPSLEPFRQDGSNEGHIFLWRNVKIICKIFFFLSGALMYLSVFRIKVKLLNYVKRQQKAYANVNCAIASSVISF